jgi:hypothetical protein
MEYFNSLFEKKNMSQTILTVIFIVYLLFGYRMPSQVATMIDTNYGKIIVALFAIILFAYSNPVLGVLGIMVAYELIKRSSDITGSYALESYYPTEEKKWSPFSAHHQFPYTLEQEMVKKMAPQKFSDNQPSVSFKPVLDDLHDASPVNYEGSI